MVFFFVFTFRLCLKAAMQGFVQRIVSLMKSERLFEPQGGPIIMSQVYIYVNVVMFVYL